MLCVCVCVCVCVLVCVCRGGAESSYVRLVISTDMNS